MELGARLCGIALEVLGLVLEGELVGLTVDTSGMDDDNALKRYKEVLVLLVDAGSVTSAEVIEVGDALEDEVSEGDDDCHT